MSCLPAFSILQQFYNGLPSSSFHFSQSLQLEASLLDSSSNCCCSRKEQRGETATSQLSDGKWMTPKSSAELVKEISMFEIEILHLERYLLSLYRNAFQQHLSSVKGNREIHVQQISGPSPVVTFDKASQEKKLEMRKDLYDHQDQSSPTSALAGPNDLDQVANSESSPGRERSILEVLVYKIRLDDESYTYVSSNSICTSKGYFTCKLQRGCSNLMELGSTFFARLPRSPLKSRAHSAPILTDSQETWLLKGVLNLM